MIDPSIIEFLSSIPETWKTFDILQTSTIETHIKRLIDVGLVECKTTLEFKKPGHGKIETTVEYSGENGMLKALVAAGMLAAEKWPESLHHKEMKILSFELRRSDQGQFALAQLARKNLAPIKVITRGPNVEGYGFSTDTKWIDDAQNEPIPAIKSTKNRVQPNHPITDWFKVNGHKYENRKAAVKAYADLNNGNADKLYRDLSNDLRKPANKRSDGSNSL